LDNDINDCIAEAQKFRWFDSLDPVRQAAIVELVFNLGLPKLRTFKRFLSAVAEQRWPHAAAELRDSLWYRQVKGRGETLAKQILTGEWQ
jgi:lysozyme